LDPSTLGGPGSIALGVVTSPAPIAEGEAMY
jgi:hypothetical protein